MKINPSIPPLNIINKNFTNDDALSNILSSLRGKDTLSNRDSINNIMPEPKLAKNYSNRENQEIELYKDLISSSEYQINRLKTILEIKKNKINENYYSNLKSFSSNYQIETERNKYNAKINNLNKENSYIEKNLENECQCFKKKLQYRKENMILKEESKKIIDELSLNLQKYSFSVLDKLIQLKTLLNECSKYMTITSNSQINTQNNYHPINTYQYQSISEKNQLFQNNKKQKIENN